MAHFASLAAFWAFLAAFLDFIAALSDWKPPNLSASIEIGIVGGVKLNMTEVRKSSKFWSRGVDNLGVNLDLGILDLPWSCHDLGVDLGDAQDFFSELSVQVLDFDNFECCDVLHFTLMLVFFSILLQYDLSVRSESKCVLEVEF